MYYITTFSKDGIKKIENAISKGINDGIFFYNSDGETDKEEQIKMLKSDINHTGTFSLWDVNSKLDKGYLELVDLNTYQI